MLDSSPFGVLLSPALALFMALIGGGNSGTLEVGAAAGPRRRHQVRHWLFAVEVRGGPGGHCTQPGTFAEMVILGDITQVTFLVDGSENEPEGI
jgi:hypothetical protein